MYILYSTNTCRYVRTVSNLSRTASESVMLLCFNMALFGCSCVRGPFASPKGVSSFVVGGRSVRAVKIFFCGQGGGLSRES